MPSASELWPVTDTQAILPIICILNYKNQYSNINSTVMVDLTKKKGKCFHSILLHDLIFFDRLNTCFMYMYI